MKKLQGFFSQCYKRIKESYQGYYYDSLARKLKVDPIISYPSYKSMDPYIDIDTLKSLEPLITDFILNYIKDNNIEDAHFPTGQATLKFWQPKTTKSYYVALAKHAGEYNYFDLNDPDKYKLTPYAKELPELMKFISYLPFKKTARIMLMFDTGGNTVTAHRDHIAPNICHEFIWFRTNFKKRFYVYDKGKREYIEGYAAWFDTVNQFHGADPSDGLNFSIRVDGIFTDEFRAKIPKPPINLASTPSYWACKELLNK